MRILPKSILVTGTIAYDHLFTYDAAFLDQLRSVIDVDMLSVSFQPHRYIKQHGGTGANIAWNISLLGGRPMLTANVGPDGKEYVSLLQERGIDTTHIETKTSAMTATGVCCTDTRQHQIWFFYKGADGIGAWPGQELIKEIPRIGYAIIGARHRPTMVEALLWCRENKVPAIFDPGQEMLKFGEKELRVAIAASTGIILNEFEWEVLSKRLDCTPADVCSQAEYLIITRGEGGHTVYADGKEQSFARCNCEKVVDPTGAGDAFRAGFLIGLTNGWDLCQASQLGAVIGSFVVEQEATRLEFLDKERIEQRLRTTYGTSLPPLPF